MIFNSTRNLFLSFIIVVLAIAAPVAAFVVDPDPDLSGEPIKVIVIDPGHGGKDPGARGRAGSEEKDLTLSISLKLEKALRERTRAKVFLTRRDDRFLTLDERTAFANRNKADIFISVHINAAKRRSAHGVETYFLSYDASDDEARETAAFENDVVRFEGVTEGAPIDDIKAILWDLAQTEAHRESSKLAENIYSKLFDIIGGDFRGVKQAPFIVLVGATMPAVLVEAGFISNPDEERRLGTDRVQVKLANAIANGIETFNVEMKKRLGTMAVREFSEEK